MGDASQPEVQVTQHDVDGEPQQLRVNRSNIAIAGIVALVKLCQRQQILNEVTADFVDTIERMIGLSILLGQNRIGDKRHRAVVNDQLQVGPGTNGLDSSILALEDVLITIVLQCRISMCNVIVTVIDNCIVVAGTIVTVVVADVEVCDITQVAVGDVGHINQVTTCLTEQNGAVGNGLQLIDNASDTIQGVGRLVQVLLIGEDNLFRALVEEIRAG